MEENFHENMKMHDLKFTTYFRTFVVSYLLEKTPFEVKSRIQELLDYL